jgi:Ca2+-binding RTX toxin-like protein
MSFFIPTQPITRVGSTTTQGDDIMNTDWVRQTLSINNQNLDGSGIKIGVISDSYNRKNGETQDILTGDLPGAENPNGYTTSVEILADGTNPYGKDEGRAMLQIIHDIAPGAELMFHSAVSKTEMASAVRELQQAGADIIVDDLGFVNQSFFQDGIIAQAVNEVAAKGVVYLSAAGNDGERSYEDTFRPTNNPVNFSFDNQDYIAHNFNSNGEDIFNSFTLPQGKSLTLTFQWDDNFDNAVHDLDIFVVRNNDLNNLDIVAYSADDNIGNNPLETISFANNTDTDQFSILIAQRDNIATHPENIKYISFSSKAENFEYGHDSSTIFGHPNAAGAIAVGAVRYHTPSEIKSSSSVGGTPILLDENGNPLETSEIRLKPDITAPDSVSTTVEGFETFSGTSAAAPHVAGVTALMLQASGGEGSLTPDEVRTLLQQTANDIAASGIDYHSGAGTVQADAALELIMPLPNNNSIVRENRDNRTNNSASEAADTLTGGSADETLFGYGGDDRLQGQNGNDVLFGNQGNDLLEGNSGDDKLHGGKDNDDLRGNEGNDILSGEKGEDSLFGEMGNDTLYGGKDNDLLMGRQGDDNLYGDLGDDILIGGSGRDRFMLSATTGVDQITDFNLSEDLIGLMGGLTASQVQWQFNQTGETVISLASNGESLAILDGLHSLTQQHFVTV